MMPNPFTATYRMRLCYSAVWMVITILQINLISHFPFHTVELPLIVADVMFFNAIQAISILYVWRFVRSKHSDKKSYLHYVRIHICIMVLYGILCIVTCFSVMFMFAGYSDNFMDYMDFHNGRKVVQSILSYSVIVPIYYIIMLYRQLREKQRTENLLKERIREDKLNLLKSQINPHFLFNALNSLNSLIVLDTAKAQEMLLAMSDYLRYVVLSTNNFYVPLQQEIINSERYLFVEKLRFGDRLSYRFDVAPELLSAEVPSMLLQPLLENAVKYGLYENASSTEITASAQMEGRNIHIVITNTLEGEFVSDSKGTNTGLNNLCDRLFVSYGDAASLTAAGETDRFVVSIHLPLQHL